MRSARRRGAAPKAERPLTWRQKAFIRLYLQYGSAVRASREAGYKQRKTREDGSAGGPFEYLLGNPRIRREVEREQRKVFAELRQNAERGITGLLAVAEADIGDMYGADGKQLPPEEWPPELRRALFSVKAVPVYEGGKRVGVQYMPRFLNRLKALKLLGKHLGMFDRRVKHRGPGGGPLLVESPRARLLVRIAAMLAAKESG